MLIPFYTTCKIEYIASLGMLESHSLESQKGQGTISVCPICVNCSFQILYQPDSFPPFSFKRGQQQSSLSIQFLLSIGLLTFRIGFADLASLILP